MAKGLLLSCIQDPDPCIFIESAGSLFIPGEADAVATPIPLGKARIVQEGGDYCMQLKGNQGDMHADVRTFVADRDIEYIDEYISVDGDHGRIEERSYSVYDVPDYLAETHQWPHLGAFVHVVSKRTVGQTTSHSERLYLLSKCVTAQAAATLIRGHWEIENSLHWSLDVVMNDDQHRARKDNGDAGQCRKNPRCGCCGA